MAFLDVHANTEPRTRVAIPYLLEVQADLLASLGTCVVVPLYRKDAAQALGRLTPVLEVEGQICLALVPELAGVARRDLGPVAGSLVQARGELIAALDFLFTGA